MIALLGYPGWLELSVLVILALLFLGRRLPQAAGSVGRTIVEFRKALGGAFREPHSEEAPRLPRDDGCAKKLEVDRVRDGRTST